MGDAVPTLDREKALNRTARRTIRLGAVVMAAALAHAGPSAMAQGGLKTASFKITSVRQGQGMEVTVRGEAWLTSDQARVEMRDPMSGQAAFLVTGGYLYQLDRGGKKGIRAPLPDDVKKKRDNFDFFVTQFAFDARGALKGAKKVGTETVSGYACDVLTNTETNPAGAARTVRVWIPQKMTPSFPIKAVVTDRLVKPDVKINQTMTITLTQIRLGQTIPATTFTVPSDYKIATGSPRPPGGAPGGVGGGR